MLATVKKIRTVRPPTHGEIPPGKIEANTPEWRARVLAELAKRPRGEQTRIVEYVRRWYPKFSTGTLSATLADDEKPGQLRHSKYIPLINRYLWPAEFAAGPLDEDLEAEDGMITTTHDGDRQCDCDACRRQDPSRAALTADTITDEQIRELRDNAWDEIDCAVERNSLYETIGVALAKYRHPEGRAEIREARARCVEILNARRSA